MPLFMDVHKVAALGVCRHRKGVCPPPFLERATGFEPATLSLEGRPGVRRVPLASADMHALAGETSRGAVRDGQLLRDVDHALFEGDIARNEGENLGEAKVRIGRGREESRRKDLDISCDARRTPS